MSGFSLNDGELFVDGVSCLSIARAIPTPFYLYSAQKIADQYNTLSHALSAAWQGKGTPLIAFACKSNSNIAVLRLLASLGAGADVVSVGEIKRAVAAGVVPDKIIFSGVGKTAQELEYAIALGIHQINIETAGELDHIIALSAQLKKSIRVAFRYTPDVEAKTHAKISTGEDDHKFGLLADEIIELYTKAHDAEYVQPVGISVHIGSQLFELDAFRQAYSKVADLIARLRGNNLPVEVADLGGGLGVAYKDGQPEFPVTDYAHLINQTFSKHDVQIMLEPGRYLVAESGALIAKVTYIKDRPEKTFVITDAGMNDLIRPTLYEAWHPILPLKSDTSPQNTLLADVVGPVCETGDYFALDRQIHASIKPNDFIAVLVAGAYGSVMSSQYNSRPFIAEIIVHDGQWQTVRRPQAVEEIWDHEIIPDWLK